MPALRSAVSMSPVPYTLSAATKENGTFAAIARAIIRRAIWGFVAKPTSSGTCAALMRVGIVRPFFRQIKRPVDEGMAVTRHVGGEDADLAVGDLTRRARVLACNPARNFALLQKAGLVNDQNRILISKRFQRVIAHDVAQRIRVPPPAAQDRLLAPRTGIARRFRAHPARLAPLIPKQTVQEHAADAATRSCVKSDEYALSHRAMTTPTPLTSSQSMHRPSMISRIMVAHGFRRSIQNATVMLGCVDSF